MACARIVLRVFFQPSKEERMRRNLVLVCFAAFALSAFALSAADLTIEMQVNTVAKDYAGNYLTFKGLVNSVEKDQFAADATSGASKLASTEVFNGYRMDVKGIPTMPMTLRHVLLYSVADDAIRMGDNLKVTKAASGVITVRFVHRGTAYEIVTDATGKVSLPASGMKVRKIGHTDNVISTDFSASGKTADVDWKKVWDASIADGKQVGSTPAKTGKITADAATSDMFVWTGAYQLAFDGKILKITAGLDAKKM
jgi:hypothetical protein